MKKIIRFLFPITLILCNLWASKAQSSTYPWLTQRWYDTDSALHYELVMVYPLKDNTMLFTGWEQMPRPIINGDYPVPYPVIRPVLYRTSSTGAILYKKRFFKTGDTYIQYLGNVFESDDDSLVLIGDGIHEIDSMPALVYMKCDHSLNPGTIKTYPLFDSLPSNSSSHYSASYPPLYYPGYGVGGGGGIFKKHPDGGFYGVITTIGFNKIQDGWEVGAPIFLNYFRINTVGDLLDSSHITSRMFYASRNDVDYSPSLHQYLTMDVTNARYMLDSNMKLIGYKPSQYTTDDSFQMVYPGVNSMMPYKNKHLVAGEVEFTTQTGPMSWQEYDYLKLMILNDSFRIVDSFQYNPFVPIGHSNNTATFKTIDYINADSVFMACAPIFDIYGYTLPVTIFKVDSAFKIRWQTIDSIPDFWDLESIVATPDGGCVIVGNNMVNQGSIGMFAVKYDRSGIKTAVHYFEKDMQEVTIYPNPGTDRLFVSGATQGRSFVLYDVQGRELIRAKDSELANGIHVSGLRSGIYIYRITDPGTGEMKAGKWVKQ